MKILSNDSILSIRQKQNKNEISLLILQIIFLYFSCCDNIKFICVDYHSAVYIFGSS